VAVSTGVTEGKKVGLSVGATRVGDMGVCVGAGSGDEIGRLHDTPDIRIINMIIIVTRE
jgi:hypothetical protein